MFGNNYALEGLRMQVYIVYGCDCHLNYYIEHIRKKSTKNLKSKTSGKPLENVFLLDMLQLQQETNCPYTRLVHLGLSIQSHTAQCSLCVHSNKLWYALLHRCKNAFKRFSKVLKRFSDCTHALHSYSN